MGELPPPYDKLVDLPELPYKPDSAYPEAGSPPLTSEFEEIVRRAFVKEILDRKFQVVPVEKPARQVRHLPRPPIRPRAPGSRSKLPRHHKRKGSL